MNPTSKNHSHSSPSGCPLGSDIDVDEFKVTKELLDKVIAFGKSMFDVNEDDIKQHNPFDPSFILMVRILLCTWHCLFLLLPLGLELMIKIIERRNRDNILVEQSLTS